MFYLIEHSVDPFTKMKNCRIILLENCGHTLYRNNSLLFNKIVIEFLKV